MEKLVEVSIRYLAEFLRRGGSIDSRFSGVDRAAEGSRIHRRLQKQAGKNYKAEVPLSIEMTTGKFTCRLSGRADGVVEEDGGVVVDEIKTTTHSFEALTEEDYPAHWAQGCCYGYILCAQRSLSGATIQLTYYNVDTDEIRRFRRSYTTEQLELFVRQLLEEYRPWAELSLEWKSKRDVSLRELAFPFSHYREGQRSLAIAVYNACKDGGILFACAPTGTGKTISTLFPAMKALGEGYGERIFYLTAKTITRKAAEEALQKMRMGSQLDFLSITLTAKDKICFLEERACLPEVCPYANGYYDRVNEAVYKILQQGGALGREEIEGCARKFQLCPYELSLDLALWCDCIICDYNYLFDPVVHLQRFFEGKGGENLFLVDEAHNLVARSREMYSANLYKSHFYGFKKQLPKQFKALHRALNAVNSAFVAIRKECAHNNTQVLRRDGLPSEFNQPLDRFIRAAEDYLEDNKGSEWEQELLGLYFETLFYTRISELYSEVYTTLLYRTANDVVVKLFCLDPSAFLRESLDKGRAAVFFSATLSPLPYYREVLGGAGGKQLSLPSPFPPERLGLYVADGISTKYADREMSLGAIAELLYTMVDSRKGNYIAYFPSYAYMRRVADAFTEAYPQVEVLIQQSGMEEAARENFLAQFHAGREDTLLGFCVLGGIFSEGVDLAGECLIGSAVVGVGLPQIGTEQDALRDYYDDKNGDGFAFAYQFPGMNKVLQAAGRVIRSEQDRGVVLLIDSRFTTGRYKALFPAHWGHWQRVTKETLPGKLSSFWAEFEE